mgnify:CR=1 FL=1
MIENRDDFVTMTRLLRKSRTDHIRIKIMGSEYLWIKNVFINLHNRSIHDMHLNAYMYIKNCTIVARAMPSIKNKQLQDAHNFIESTRDLVNIMKGCN